MPVVPVGEAAFPVLTSSPVARGPYSDSTEAAETTGTFSTELLAPERIQASFFYRRVDRARLAGMDAALRSALASALSEKVDAEVVNGSNGLLTGTNLANHNVTAVTNYARYNSLAYGRVDGRYADNVAQIRIGMGSGTYAHAAGVYRATEADRSALDRLIADTAGVRVSAHVPAVDGNNRQNAVVRLGSEPAMVAPDVAGG